MQELTGRWERLKASIRAKEKDLQIRGLLEAPETALQETVPQTQAVLQASPPPPRGDVPSSPASDVSPPKRGSPARTPSPMERSPKSKKRQYELRLREFSDWLTEQQSAFQELVTDENVPSTLEALKLRLQQFQVRGGKRTPTNISRTAANSFRTYSEHSWKEPTRVKRTLTNISRTPTNISRTSTNISRTAANISRTPKNISRTAANSCRTYYEHYWKQPTRVKRTSHEQQRTFAEHIPNITGQLTLTNELCLKHWQALLQHQRTLVNSF